MDSKDRTLDELRPALVRAVLPHVPFDGWSRLALGRAADDEGVDPQVARLVFPRGGIDMVAAYIAMADDAMLQALKAQDLAAMKIRARIATAVRTRLEQAAPHKEAVRRASAMLLLPQHAPLAARTLWRTADAMWRAAGDTATDFNHYSKRAILSGVYSSTLLIWLNDESPDHGETWDFLDRRIDDVMQIEKLKARVRRARAQLPNRLPEPLADPLGWLGRLRYTAGGGA